jgi:hypothetical protein
MSIRSDVALQAIETLASQARVALSYMAVSSTDPRDLDTALTLVNGTVDLVKAALVVADIP